MERLQSVLTGPLPVMRSDGRVRICGNIKSSNETREVSHAMNQGAFCIPGGRETLYQIGSLVRIPVSSAGRTVSLVCYHQYAQGAL